ncbi:MAG: ribosome biogenesis GTPase Der [Chloroflexota bacterium]|nr:ribosome biogenesis GTPase Der [Chloroflexota bacterium]PLS78443.1 MAG: ribosome biogenesis GTPase Der [Chloroflexota bacterium]
MPQPIVAIVGRPNVGKSTLFNKLVGERRAIVEDEPGTTRDRLYGEAEWRGREFTIVDTAGILPGEENQTTASMAEIVRATRAQAQLAIDEADAILFLVDVKSGITAADEEVAEMLRQTSKPVIVGANKADSLERAQNAVEFWNLGLTEPVPISAYHGTGTGDLLDALYDALPPFEEDPDEEYALKIAIVGRPNVGKSSLLNRLLGIERVVVSDIPGTTRDTIDTVVEFNGEKILLIDTAGIRRRGRIDQGIEKYSVLRALRAIERADVALLMVDATEGVTSQDAHVAGMVLEAYKGIAVLVNKWDALEKDAETFDQWTRHVQAALHFIPYAPMLFISAKTGQRVEKILELAQQINAERNTRISTAKINTILRDAVRDHPPSSIHKGAHLRIFYATQAQVAPPVFLFFSNAPEEIHFSYKRYLENRIRAEYPFVGTPIILVFKSREE